MEPIAVTPMEHKLYISIAGIIGAGKTTLAKALSKTMNLPIYCEDAQDDPYLKKFYESDTNEFGYQLQISLLTKRFEQQQQIIWNAKGAVQDRSIYEDGIFCKMLHDDKKISELDWTTYNKLAQIMFNLCGKPTVVIYLDVSPEEAHRRLRMRNREIECKVPLEYLKRLHEAYDEWIGTMKDVRIIRVDYEKYKLEYTSRYEFDEKIHEVSTRIAEDIKRELSRNNIVSI